MISLIKALTKDEISAFKAFLKKRNKRSNTKNLQLLEGYLKNDLLEIKRAISANAFRGLKMRLKENLLTFMANRIEKYETNSNITLAKQLALLKQLFTQNFVKEAFDLAQQLEKIAQKKHNYRFLSELYNELIIQSNQKYAPKQQELFKLARQNQELLRQQELLNMAFAQIQRQAQTNSNIGLIIDKTFKNLNIDSAALFDYKNLYLIGEMANKLGANENNFTELNLFFEEKQKYAEQKFKQNPDDLYYKSAFLTVLANIHFRRKDFTKSIDYCNITLNTLLSKKQSNELQLLHIRTILALNYNYLSKSKEAISILEHSLQNTNAENQFLARLALSSFYVQNNETNLAKKNISTLQNSDAFYERKMGKQWIVIKCLMEACISFDLNDIEFTEHRLNSIVRRNKPYLEQHADGNIYSFIKLMRYLCKHPEKAKTIKFTERINETIKWKPLEKEDLFFMTFYAWLKSKNTGENLSLILKQLLAI